MANNRRDQIRMTDEERAEFLGGRRTMQVATHGADGTIHLVAMWYGFDGERPAFETFARSQKVLNLRRNPNLTVLVEDGDTYETLRGVQIVGRAELIEEGDPRVIDIAESVVTRYIDTSSPEEGRAVAEAMANKRAGVIIHADKIVTWDHTKLGGAY
ncbi:MAG: TIGR03618 family F420-dependent PPOX class oxidoreductase [Candidatus Microthrix sp.]|uniref:TIGR03618 family F420-dependent PPOX class oxidoreductase n=1 Tax=Candidatus Neomicrothrix subdominans TaxID=2954438 RepID=A0A936N9N6_9ACTN|nr:TIGR03618 family F420-dependent PPOX class oxidoreductase [Candidatus Microthrix subdominans]